MGRGVTTPTAVGVLVSVIIVAAVASIAYYQFDVAQPTTTTASQPPTGVVCPSSACVNVTIPSGASTPPSGYSAGQKTRFGFSPDTVTVVIGKNNTLYFINADAGLHTATSDPAGAFDTGNINPGATAQVTLATPGTYSYKCIYHPWMQGVVVVKSG